MGINYTEESKKLESFVPGDSKKFWKPKPGQYKVIALTELEESTPFVDKVTKEETQQVKIELLVGEYKEKVTWTMGKGVSPASAYGQLCRLGKKKGTLKDLNFMIVVTFDGKKNTYTIVEL